jgi:hypothetical protein
VKSRRLSAHRLIHSRLYSFPDVYHFPHLAAREQEQSEHTLPGHVGGTVRGPRLNRDLLRAIVSDNARPGSPLPEVILTDAVVFVQRVLAVAAAVDAEGRRPGHGLARVLAHRIERNDRPRANVNRKRRQIHLARDVLTAGRFRIRPPVVPVVAAGQIDIASVSATSSCGGATC